MRIPFLDKDNPLPPLTDAECKAILELTNNSVRMALLVGLNSGIALREVLGLRKGDIDMAAQSLNIPIKGGVRRVVMPAGTLRKLGEHMRSHEGVYLFDIPPGSMTKILNDIGTRCGLKLNWQRIRSTYIRNAARAGVPILTCAHNVGTDPANIKHYYLLTPEEERAKINNIVSD